MKYHYSGFVNVFQNKMQTKNGKHKSSAIKTKQFVKFEEIIHILVVL